MFDNTNTTDQAAGGVDPQATAPTPAGFGAPAPTGPSPFIAPVDPPATPAGMTPEMSTLNAMTAAPAGNDYTTPSPVVDAPTSAPEVPTAVADPTMSSNYVDAISPSAAEPTTNSPSLPASSAPEPSVAFDSSSAAGAPVAPPPMTEEASNTLSEIKQDALQQLSPLVDHLEQTPEEKFRTTMMMLQATDNHDLVKTAYEAAQSITDEKARARALLDVVNEINYFHQQEKQQ